MLRKEEQTGKRKKNVQGFYASGGFPMSGCPVTRDLSPTQRRRNDVAVWQIAACSRLLVSVDQTDPHNFNLFFRFCIAEHAFNWSKITLIQCGEQQQNDSERFTTLDKVLHVWWRAYPLKTDVNFVSCKIIKERCIYFSRLDSQFTRVSNIVLYTFKERSCFGVVQDLAWLIIFEF